jgi:hypothetical protein
MTLITAGPRPASVFFRGGEIMIRTHDIYHITMRRRMLRDLHDLHPDGGARRRIKQSIAKGSIFRQALSHYRTWLGEERRWYRVFSLSPPTLAMFKVRVEVKEFIFTKTRKGTKYFAPFTTSKVRTASAGEGG